jgi:hypothetical protein
MKRYFRYRSLMARLAQLVAICGLTSQAYVATAETWQMDIRRMPESNGDVSYEVEFGGLSRQIVHLPNGTAITPTSPGVDATYNSSNALKASFVGNWTIEIPAFGSITPQEFYTFQIYDFPESLLYTTPPEITSPIDQSIVPVDFTMTWAWPVGVTPPPSRSTLIRRSGPGTAASSHESSASPADYLSAAETLRNSSSIADKAIIRAGDWYRDTLVPYMSAVTPQQANSHYNISLSSSFRSYSAPITVFGTVPEPASILLLLAGLMLANFSVRQRGRRNR